MKKRFYFPLTVTLYESDDYGNLDWNSPCELDGRYANDFQSEIEEKFESYTKDDIEDMATYFHGSEKVAAKLKSMKWGFESIGDKLFGSKAYLRIMSYLEKHNAELDPNTRRYFDNFYLGVGTVVMEMNDQIIATNNHGVGQWDQLYVTSSGVCSWSKSIFGGL